MVMENLVEILKNDNSFIICFVLLIVLILGFIILLVKMQRLNKRYKTFMKKLSSNTNIEEDLESYIYRVEKVEKQNLEILSYCKSLEQELTGCIQKIGIVRYSAFKDTGSDLSFALAMLDEKNNGVVLNGIYSREMSNIYAKPVENGKSKYTLSEEEKQAIEKAVNSKQVYRIEGK